MPTKLERWTNFLSHLKKSRQITTLDHIRGMKITKHCHRSYTPQGCKQTIHLHFQDDIAFAFLWISSQGQEIYLLLISYLVSLKQNFSDLQRPYWNCLVNIWKTHSPKNHMWKMQVAMVNEILRWNRTQCKCKDTHGITGGPPRLKSAERSVGVGRAGRLWNLRPRPRAHVTWPDPNPTVVASTGWRASQSQHGCSALSAARIPHSLMRHESLIN